MSAGPTVSSTKRRVVRSWSDLPFRVRRQPQHKNDDDGVHGVGGVVGHEDSPEREARMIAEAVISTCQLARVELPLASSVWPLSSSVEEVGDGSPSG